MGLSWVGKIACTSTWNAELKVLHDLSYQMAEEERDELSQNVGLVR